MTGTIAGFTSTGIDDNATSTAITIDASENVGIGTSSPAQRLHITGGRSMFYSTDNYAIGVGKAADLGGYMGSDGVNEIVFSEPGGVERMRLSAASGDLRIATGNLVIGTSGKGIDFSAATPDGTGSTGSEVLDDYEEGTWTPTISNGITSPTYSAQWGSYTKIGKTVYVRFSLAVTGGTLNSSHIYFSGLPFATEAADPQAGVAWSYCSMELKNSNLPTGFAYGTVIRMYTAATVTAYRGTDLADSTFAARGSITYEI
jgi:hypothetical protein